MKNCYYFFIYLSILSLISCSKESDIQIIERKIIGTWNWTESNGGFSGVSHHTPENTGDEIHFIFNKEKIFNKIMNQQTILTPNYSISRGKSILFGNEYDFLIINYRYDLPDTIMYQKMRYIILKIDDELILEEDVFDGYTHRFEKIKN